MALALAVAAAMAAVIVREPWARTLRRLPSTNSVPRVSMAQHRVTRSCDAGGRLARVCLEGAHATHDAPRRAVGSGDALSCASGYLSQKGWSIATDHDVICEPPARCSSAAADARRSEPCTLRCPFDTCAGGTGLRSARRDVRTRRAPQGRPETFAPKAATAALERRSRGCTRVPPVPEPARLAARWAKPRAAVAAR